MARGVTLGRMSEPRPPELRASDAERERTADQLRHAAGEGRLTVDELDERLDAAYAARTRGELERLVADVAVPVSTTGDSGLTVRRGGDEGTRHIVSVMGGADRRGWWRVGRQCLSLNIMGGADLDLNDAELADDVVELTVLSLMGGADIHVPEGLNVEVSDFALMGGNDVTLGNPAPTPGGPTLRLRLISIMGGSDVRRGRKLSRRERRAQRDLHRRHG
jgi:Domain of unknown function (DUF1707)